MHWQWQSSLLFNTRICMFVDAYRYIFNRATHWMLYASHSVSINQSICVYFKHDNRTFVTIFGSDKTYT